MENIQLLIIDMGSQYTLVIGRTLRELGVRSITLSPVKASEWLKENTPKGIILSGGSASVYDEDAPSASEKILTMGVPILGICYGFQWLMHKLGGTVVSDVDGRGYGDVCTHFFEDPLFENCKHDSEVWASHGDFIASLAPGFETIADSGDARYVPKVTEAAANLEKKIWGVQFHPEVTHTYNGKTILRNFLEICDANGDWNPSDIVTEIQDAVYDTIGNKKAIIGFSGGVDSTTLATICQTALGKKMLAVCIDTGGLRQDEISEIKEIAKVAGVRLLIVQAKDRFLSALNKATDAQEKRKCFKEIYIQVLEEIASNFGAEYLIQGTLAPDVIESGKVGGADVIKDHHNLIDDMTYLKTIHPFSGLFKYEVRDLARSVELPKKVWSRHPFPGPGLYVRIISEPVDEHKLEVLQWADAKVREILIRNKEDEKISQLIVDLVCVRTVGIKGDKRAYGWAIVVRAISTADFMTADGYEISSQSRREIKSAVTKHADIVRVWFDETNKPPATIELE